MQYKSWANVSKILTTVKSNPQEVYKITSKDRIRELLCFADRVIAEGCTKTGQVYVIYSKLADLRKIPDFFLYIVYPESEDMYAYISSEIKKI